jgi:hypothetical protein
LSRPRHQLIIDKLMLLDRPASIWRGMSVYIMARISTIYGNQIVTEYLVFIVFIIDYKLGIRDSKLGIITCI